MKKLKYLTSLLLVLFCVTPYFIQAQGGNPSTGGGGGGNPPGNTTPPPAVNYKITIPNPLKNGVDDIPELIRVIIDNVVIPIGATVVVVMIIYSGFQFVTAQGNQTKLDNAKKSILYAMIGAAVLLGAKVITAAIEGTIEQLGG